MSSCILSTYIAGFLSGVAILLLEEVVILNRALFGFFQKIGLICSKSYFLNGCIQNDPCVYYLILNGYIFGIYSNDRTISVFRFYYCIIYIFSS